MKTSIRTVICFAAVLLCAWGAMAEQLEITGDVRMRSEPKKSASVVSIAPKGAVVPLISQEGGWYKVEYDGKQGWIYSELAQSTGPNAGDIFTKQDVSMLPPVPLDPDEGKDEHVKYARVLLDKTKILEYLDPQAPYLHIANKGEWFVLVKEGTSWCCVEYKDANKDTIGWMKCTSLEILDTKPKKDDIVKNEAKTLLFGLLAAAAIILVISGIVTILHLRSDRKRKIYVQKNVLILAKEAKHVQYPLTNSAKPMERCFSEVGFNVEVVKDSVTARDRIMSRMPDLILVDWDFETAIFAKIDNLFARMTLLPRVPHFLFYNVPDPTVKPPIKALQNVNLLGITFSDRDIFQVVTPLIVHQADKNIQKSQQRCALEGEIAGGNLLEVLQFIEIGSKTGCLMVEMRGPFGLVYFGDGRIIYAAARGDSGEPVYGVEGVYAILNQPAGKFRFITNKQPKAANLNLPTLSVLMEWTKTKDEARK